MEIISKHTFVWLMKPNATLYRTIWQIDPHCHLGTMPQAFFAYSRKIKSEHVKVRISVCQRPFGTQIYIKIYKLLRLFAKSAANRVNSITIYRKWVRFV